MELFEPLQISVKIPSAPLDKHKVGGNYIYKLFFKERTIDVKVRNSEFTGYFKFETGLDYPFDKIYLKDPNRRGKCPEGILSLIAQEHYTFENWKEDIKLNWEQFLQADLKELAAEINELWRNKFQFNEEDTNKKLKGLRKPQIGAIHAISAHFSTDLQIEPATVVLPTGTGKTETMLGTMVYQRCNKILVIVPSDTLRTQLSKKFIDLGYLQELNVVPVDIALPYVAVIKKGIKSPQEARQLVTESNVLIATTSVLNAFSELALNSLCGLCTHLFVDEAHHISATSWMAIREHFQNKRVIQFTATPFRNDKKSLGGKIIYNYTMGEAQRSGYFTSVNLLPVEEYYADDIDKSIAYRAVEKLRDDLNNNLDHLLMARASNKTRANEIFIIYQSIASEYNPIIVHSSYSSSEIRNRLNSLLSRKSKIVICVDMLGEGYDFPNLKIAALHDHHKSLAITLQFIGRFTRVNQNIKIGQASVVLNVADPNVDAELQHLYSSDSDWNTILRRLSEGRISREIRLQEVIDSLQKKGNLHEQLSLWNLEPSCSVMLFKTNCDNWDPECFMEKMPKFEQFWHAVSDDEKLLVILAVQATPVRWGNYKEIKDTNYKILIAHFDISRSALFIFSNDYEAFRVENLVSVITKNCFELVSGDQIFNVFNGIEYPLARNLGASQIGAISFTQYFGPNVTEGLSLVEKSQSSLSNIAALGYESGNRVIWGCSQRRGKVWSPQKVGNITDWCNWARTAWDKIFSSPPDPNNLTKNFLRPERLVKPYKEYPISAQWGDYLFTAFEDKIEFYFGTHLAYLYSVELKTAGKYDDGNVKLQLKADDNVSEYKICILGNKDPKGYSYELISGKEVFIKRGNYELCPLAEYFQIDPVMVYYSDGSFSYNANIVYVSQTISFYDKSDIIAFDWGNTDIKNESMGVHRDENSIQWRWFKEMQQNYDVIINDDGSGEAADLLGLKIVDNCIELTLVHCKYSNSIEPGSRLADLYEVCGQAQRCIRWKHLNLTYLYKHIQRREEKWRNRSICYSRFLKGSIKDLAAIKERSRTTPIRFNVVIVQPGLSINKISEGALKLLGSTAHFIKKTTMADLVVIGSR